jgi:hypothetical protein
MIVDLLDKAKSDSGTGSGLQDSKCSVVGLRATTILILTYWIVNILGRAKGNSNNALSLLENKFIGYGLE